MWNIKIYKNHSLFIFINTHKSMHIIFPLQSLSLPPPHLFPTPITLQQPRLPHKFPKRPPLLKQLLRRIKLLNPTRLQHDNTVTIQDSVDAVRDSDDGAFTKQGGAESGLEQGVGFDVDGGGGFVKDEDVGGGEEGPC